VSFGIFAQAAREHHSSSARIDAASLAVSSEAGVLGVLEHLLLAAGLPQEIAEGTAASRQ